MPHRWASPYDKLQAKVIRATTPSRERHLNFHDIWCSFAALFGKRVNTDMFNLLEAVYLYIATLEDTQGPV